MPGAGLVISPSTLTFIKILGCSHCIHFFFLILFMDLVLAVLGLHCCVGFSLVAVSRGNSLVAIHGLLTVVAFLVAEHRLQARGLQ